MVGFNIGLYLIHWMLIEADPFCWDVTACWAAMTLKESHPSSHLLFVERRLLLLMYFTSN